MIVLIFVIALAFGVTATCAIQAFWTRRARLMLRERPGSWVRPMSVGARVILVYIDSSDIQLIGAFGRTYKSWKRSQLTAAHIGEIKFPIARRKGLVLAFDDGQKIKLVTTRRGGAASTVPEATDALEYLGMRSAR